MTKVAATSARAVLGAAALAAAGPAGAEEADDTFARALGIFASACLDQRPGFEGTAAALAALGLTRGDAGPFFASADGAITALASPGHDLPEGVGASCHVIAPAATGVAPDRVADRLAARIDAPLAHGTGPGVTAGGFEAREIHSWSWREDGHSAQAVLAVGADRGLGLTLATVPAAAEERP